MKRWLIFVLAVPVFLSVVSYGDISFDINPYVVHTDSLDLAVDYDNSLPDGYIFDMSQNGQTINPIWQRFTLLVGISYDPETDDVFIMEYISPGNYRVSELSSSVYNFDIKKPFGRYSRGKSLVYDSTPESFYVDEYKGDTLNQFSINGFDDYTYEKSYDLNSLISEIYIVILISLLVFSTVRATMRVRTI